MSGSNLFLITEIPGFTPQIGRLVSMLNYVRATTLSDVAGLGVGELDYLRDSQSNSIGALLSHIAAAEVGYQAATFLGRGLNEAESQEWGAAVDLGATMTVPSGPAVTAAVKVSTTAWPVGHSTAATAH